MNVFGVVKTFLSVDKISNCHNIKKCSSTNNCLKDMDLKLEDFDKQTEQGLQLEEIEEKSDQGLKLEDNEEEIFFLFEDLNEEPKKKTPVEAPGKKPEETPTIRGLDQKPGNILAFGSIDRKPENEDQAEKKKLRRLGSPLRGFLWRFFACCVLINLSIWAYFYFAKGVSVLEGLRQVRSEIQTKRNKPVEQIDKPTVGLKTPPPKGKEAREIAQEKADQLNRQYHQEKVDRATVDTMVKTRTIKPTAMYSWTNEKGHRAYSNKGFPEGESYTDPKIEWR